MREKVQGGEVGTPAALTSCRDSSLNFDTKLTTSPAESGYPVGNVLAQEHPAMTNNITSMFLSLLLFLTLAGAAFSQEAGVAPQSLSFAPQLINLLSAGSAAQNVTLTNTGSADLKIASVSASGGYSQKNNCSVLASAASCTISVTFVPGTIGQINGAITISDNAPSSPQVVSLSGKGL